MDKIKTSWFNYKNLNKKNINYIDLNNRIKEKIKKLPALKIIQNNSLLKKTINDANSFMNQKKIFIIFGTGGSNLGARALINSIKKSKNKIYFFDNIDPNKFEIFLNKFELDKIGFIIISKSGSTPETLSQFSCLIELFNSKHKLENLFKNCLIITEDSPNPLRTIGDKNNCIIVNHEKDIGGRYSIFSNVGILPALIAGLDINEFYKGASEIFDKIIEDNYYDHANLAEIFTFQTNLNLKNNVVFTYSDSLFFYGKWYLQLWAESIGKDNKGITPIHSVGTTDQHSQLQLYLAGPKDKFFTFITTNNSGVGIKMNERILNNNELEYLAGKTMGDLMQAEQLATIQTFKKNNFIFREINLPSINEFTMGQLMCLAIIETITACTFFEVNPFDQPAVEEGKKLTKQYLS